MVSTGFLIRGETLKTSLKVALAGIVCAISVMIMMLTIIPTLEISLPVLAGMVMTVLVLELGVKWGITGYVTVAIVSLLSAPSLESRVLFIAFFGYYPVLKALLERLHLKWVQWLLKLSVFNVAIVLAYTFLIRVVAALDITEFMVMGEYMPMVLLLVGNGIFILYDIAVTKWITMYVYTLQSRLHKMFRF